MVAYGPSFEEAIELIYAENRVVEDEVREAYEICHVLGVTDYVFHSIVKSSSL